MKNLIFALVFVISGLCTHAQNPNWSYCNTNNLTTNVRDMIFIDDQRGFLLDSISLFETKDGGNNWNYKLSIFNSLGISNIFHINDSILFYSADTSRILKEITFSTRDTSCNYTTQLTIFQYGPGVGIDYRNFTSLGNEIWLTKNDTLAKYENGLLTNIKPNIKSFAIHNGFISAANTNWFYFSNDTAQTWDSASFIDPTWNTSIMNGIGTIQTYYNGGDTIFAIGRSFPSNDYISYDKGKHWSELSLIGSTGKRPSTYHFYNSKSIIGSWKGIVLTSSDYGHTFIKDSVDKYMGYSSIYILNDSVVFLYGDNGKIYKSVNAGGLIGLQEKKLEHTVQIYPNPSRDVLFFEYDKSVQLNTVAIYDIEGELIQKYSPRKRNLNISGIEPGVYILKLESKTERLSKKIIIQ
jgi:hypothetical protein